MRSTCPLCGMLPTDDRWHPYAACLAFKGTDERKSHDARRTEVEANIDFVKNVGFQRGFAEGMKCERDAARVYGRLAKAKRLRPKSASGKRLPARRRAT